MLCNPPDLTQTQPLGLFMNLSEWPSDHKPLQIHFLKYQTKLPPALGKHVHQWLLLCSSASTTSSTTPKNTANASRLPSVKFALLQISDQQLRQLPENDLLPLLCPSSTQLLLQLNFPCNWSASASPKKIVKMQHHFNLQLIASRFGNNSQQPELPGMWTTAWLSVARMTVLPCPTEISHPRSSHMAGKGTPIYSYHLICLGANQDVAPQRLGHCLQSIHWKFGKQCIKIWNWRRIWQIWTIKKCLGSSQSSWFCICWIWRSQGRWRFS